MVILLPLVKELLSCVTLTEIARFLLWRVLGVSIKMIKNKDFLVFLILKYLYHNDVSYSTFFSKLSSMFSQIIDDD